MVLLMPRVRTEEQLRLAREAPPRPEKKDAGDDMALWRELQRGWVAAWGGRLLEAGVSDKEWVDWWKQSKKQHKALLRFASEITNEVDIAAAGAPNGVAVGAPPTKVVARAVHVAALDYVTTAWLQRHAPEITSLSASNVEMSDGSRRVFLNALVAGEEREASVDYSVDGLMQQDDAGRKAALRHREQAALLKLASGPERAAARAAAAARLRQQLAPERARRAKLRRAEWLLRRRLGEKDINPYDDCDPLDLMGEEDWNEHTALAALEQGLAVPCCIRRSRASAGGETEYLVR